METVLLHKSAFLYVTSIFRLSSFVFANALLTGITKTFVPFYSSFPEIFRKIAQRAFALAISIMVVTNTFAQGAAGIDAASSELATYMDPLGNMMMILGGLVGSVGAVRVYLKWNSGDQDVQKAVMGWMGSCIFLVVSGVVVKAFFGI